MRDLHPPSSASAEWRNGAEVPGEVAGSGADTEEEKEKEKRVCCDWSSGLELLVGENAGNTGNARRGDEKNNE